MFAKFCEPAGVDVYAGQSAIAAVYEKSWGKERFEKRSDA